MSLILNKKKSKLKNIPKKQKFKKYHKGFVSQITYKKSSTALYYGIFGLKILKKGRFTIKQLNAAKQKITKFIRKKEKLWIRGFTDIPVTQKPNEMRMGKGKGNVDHWIVRVSAGFVIFELSKMPGKKAIYLLLNAAKKLPVPTIIIHNSKHLLL